MPVLTDAGIELITSKFNEADTDSTGSINAEQLTTILTPFCESEGYDIPNEEQIAKRLASLKTEKPGELTLIELLFVIAYMKIMLICEGELRFKITSICIHPSHPLTHSTNHSHSSSPLHFFLL
jgi:hypothetical protein